MRENDFVVPNKKVRVIDHAHEKICDMSKGRRVLNVGAAGNATVYRDHGRIGWLHARLSESAAHLIGLDIDADEVEIAREMGFDMIAGNAETIQLDEHFDLIILADVLEHVDNPGLLLQNMIDHLMSEDSRIVVTTPNATAMGSIVRSLLSRPMNTYWDHVATYLPEHLQAICDRHDYLLEEIAMFSFADERTPLVRLKSHMIRWMGSIAPRINGWIYCIIKRSE